MDFKRYETSHIQMPRQVDFTTHYWYRAGEVILKKVGEPALSAEEVNLVSGCVTEKIKDDATYKAERDKVYQRRKDALERFTLDLFKDLDIEVHPQRYVLFELAREKANISTPITHTDFSVIYSEASDLAKLLEVPPQWALVGPNVYIMQPSHLLPVASSGKWKDSWTPLKAVGAEQACRALAEELSKLIK